MVLSRLTELSDSPMLRSGCPFWLHWSTRTRTWYFNLACHASILTVRCTVRHRWAVGLRVLEKAHQDYSQANDLSSELHVSHHRARHPKVSMSDNLSVFSLSVNCQKINSQRLGSRARQSPTRRLTFSGPALDCSGLDIDSSWQRVSVGKDEDNAAEVRWSSSG